MFDHGTNFGNHFSDAEQAARLSTEKD